MNGEEINTMEPLHWIWETTYLVSEIIKATGWYIVGILICLVYTWPRIHEKYNSFKKKRDQIEYDAKYRKCDDKTTQLLLATQMARERMQEKYLKDREIALQKEKEKKERKLQELLKLENQLSRGHYLGNNESDNSSSSSLKPKSKLRPDHNPLMGSGSSGRYIPPKRSCCSKGGCG